MELELKLKESPSDLEEVLATIKDPESVVEDSMPSTQGGEVQGCVDELNSKNFNATDSDGSNKKSHAADTNAADNNDSNQNLKSDHSNVVIETINDQEIVEPVPDAIEPTVPIDTVAIHRYSLRPKTKLHKLESHLIINDTNQINEEQKDWNLYVLLNLRHNKGEDLKEFLSLHTSISEALKEDEVMVKQAIVKEWDQVLNPAKPGDKEVLKPMSKRSNPTGKSVIPSLMFMKKKMNKVTKKLEKWKARLAAGGHRQDQELYPKKDITVPTLDHTALLTFLSSMMKRKDVKFSAMDFPGAYLSADLESEIYMVINKQNTDILVDNRPELKEFVRDNGTIWFKRGWKIIS